MARDRTRYARRRFLQGGLALTGVGLLTGCEIPRLSWKAATVPRIGFLAVGSREGRAFLIDGLLEGLREHDYIVGENIVIEYRFSEDRDDRLPDLAAELVALPVELIVASGTPASFAARQATRSIPIVMGSSSEPVASGIVDSLARPGANVTGLSLMSWQLMGKRIEQLKELIPDLALVAMFTNINNPVYVPQLDALEAAARASGIQVQRLDVRRVEDFEIGFQAAATRHAGALIVPADAFSTNNRVTIAGLAKHYRQPAIYEFKEFVEVGGLMSFGANLPDLFRRAATYVDKILKGANPGDLPIEQPTKFDFAINLKTALALGLTIPQSILQQATEIIQ
jgi:putative ABC transport system substrate-binding protein